MDNNIKFNDLRNTLDNNSQTNNNLVNSYTNTGVVSNNSNTTVNNNISFNNGNYTSGGEGTNNSLSSNINVNTNSNVISNMNTNTTVNINASNVNNNLSSNDVSIDNNASTNISPSNVSYTQGTNSANMNNNINNTNSVGSNDIVNSSNVNVIGNNNINNTMNNNTSANIVNNINSNQNNLVNNISNNNTVLNNNVGVNNTLYNDNGVFRNKVNNDSENAFGEWIDTEVDEKKGIRNILLNKKFLMVILILIFICVCVLVYKAFYLRSKVDDYQEFFTVIDKRDSEVAKVYDDSLDNEEVLKDMAASEYINCITSSIDTDNLPDSINNIVMEINNYYSKSNNYFAFKYKDLFTGFSVSYNENQKIFTASAIKGPTDIYIYEMASLGKVDLSEELTYTGNYYNLGSGILKNKEINTKYDVRTLLSYSTRLSDNAAHNMLMDRYGRENMYNFWQSLGTDGIFYEHNNWGVFDAGDASIYMEELYNFYTKDKVYGKEVMDNFINATPKFISGGDSVVANKSGWSGSALHDVAIVFADNPYVVVGLSNLGATGSYMEYFDTISDFASRLHTEYWKEKMSMCGDIKQY